MYFDIKEICKDFAPTCIEIRFYSLYVLNPMLCLVTLAVLLTQFRSGRADGLLFKDFCPLVSAVTALSAERRGTSGQICECPLYFQNKNFLLCRSLVQQCIYFAAETDKTYKLWKTKK